ncbi:hypothetical protein [Novipirellula artificiosorum]|uniref:Uncharacterized protein n=1 Tax=Novipirellula artificiosorum TaxID=2528016 RepID=A0A5C6CE21_9BACT|nr:hypothetical protein [Novipirellula artificiosorum]TWU22850.1 hypothetical protein Poly41_71120 [Novipirellula artificiosorum]
MSLNITREVARMQKQTAAKTVQANHAAMTNVSHREIFSMFPTAWKCCSMNSSN